MISLQAGLLRRTLNKLPPLAGAKSIGIAGVVLPCWTLDVDRLRELERDGAAIS